MERKRRSFLWMLTASFFLAAVVLFVLFRFVVTPPASADAADAMYTIGEWKGQVAVFEGKQRYPKQILDMPVSGLPPEMQRRLQEGVPAYSEAELSVLLEDYTG